MQMIIGLSGGLLWGLVIIALGLAGSAAINDLSERTIPNRTCLALAVTGFVFQFMRHTGQHLVGRPLNRGEAALNAHLASPLVCLLSAAALLIVLAGVEFALRRWRGEKGMGFGDVKYLSAWTCFLGPHIVPVLGLASLMGAAWALARHERDFAFAPWIGLACAIVLIALSVI